MRLSLSSLLFLGLNFFRTGPALATQECEAFESNLRSVQYPLPAELVIDSMIETRFGYYWFLISNENCDKTFACEKLVANRSQVENELQSLSNQASKLQSLKSLGHLLGLCRL